MSTAHVPILEGELAGTVSISQTFPELPSPLISRPTQLGMLEELMSFPFDAVVLDGDEDSGKTTALAQFASLHQSHTVCLFLRPITEFTYEPARIRFELCNQIHWLLFGRQLDQDAPCDGGMLRDLYGRMERKASRDKRPIHFVVDGIADIPAEAVKQSIVAMLPIGVAAFRFLLAGSEITTGVSKLPKRNVRPQRVLPFSLEEGVELFHGVATRAQVEEIHKTFRGRAGALASIRRLVASGLKLEELLETFPDTIKAIFDIEWGRIDVDSSLTNMLLGVAAFAPEVGSVPNLAALLRIQEDELRVKVASISCLRFDPKTGQIRYVSESFRKYASSRLGSARKSVLEQVVQFLQDEGGENNAFHSLPEYLEQIGDISALIAYLSTQTTAAELGRSKSIAMTIQRLGRASRLALKHEKTDAGIRFIAQRAVLRGVLNRHGRSTHIEATLRVKGEAAALALATQAFANEERLHLLAVVARTHRVAGTKIDPQIESEISRLADNTDWAELRDKALAIASELMGVFPEIATRIIERSVGGTENTQNSHSLDLAIASAYFRAASRSDARGYRTQLLDQALSPSKSKAKKALLAAAASLTPAESVEELFADLQRVQQTSEVVFLLRLWLEKHQSGPDSVRVAQRLLDTILSDAKFAPAPGLFHSAIGAVVHSDCTNEAGLRILNIVEAQLPALKTIGPMADYLRLLCEVAIARYRFAIADPLEPLVTESLALESYSDAGVRATAFAWIKSTCRRLDLGIGISDEWDLVRYVDQGFESAVDLILRSTAEQSDALSSIIDPLALDFLTDLEAVISRVNTSARRDELLEATILRLVSNSPGNLDSRLSNSARLLAGISSQSLRDDVSSQVVPWVTTNVLKFSAPMVALEKACDIVSEVAGPDDRAKLFATCYTAMPDLERSGPIGSKLLTIIESDCSRIDRVAVRIDASFSVANKLHGKNAEAAGRYYDAGSLLAASAPGKLAASGRSLRLSLFLAARALAALERANGSTPNDVARLAEAVSRIPSKVDQSNLWNFFALSLARVKKQRALEIIETRLKPILRDLLSDADLPPRELQGAIVRAAPSLWLHHSPTIDEFLGRLSPLVREEALSAIAEYLIFGEIPGEPWKQANRQHVGFSYESATDVLSLLDAASSDTIVSSAISTLLEAMRNPGMEGRLSKTQRGEIIRRIREIVAKKLPEPRMGIRHEGYVLLADAELMATERNVDFNQWQGLIARVAAIPNAADVAYLQARFVNLIPRKHATLRKILFDSACKSIESLSLIEDRMDRALTLVQESEDHFPAECKTLLSGILTQSLHTDRPSLQERRAEFLDMLHRLNPEAAAAFSSVTDSDPARRRVQFLLQLDLEEIQLAKKVRDADSLEDADRDFRSLPDACLRELASLNNSRVTTRSFDDNIELISSAKEFPIDLAYPVFAFAIEATALRYEQTAQATEYLRPLFNAAIESWDLAVVATTVGDGRAAPEFLGGREESPRTSLHVANGMRDQTIKTICNWIGESKSTYLKVVDPFFRAADLETLLLFAAQVPHAEITLVTSMFATRPPQGMSRQEEFQASWRHHFKTGREPFCQVVIAGIASSGQFSVHNRWIVLDDLGIDLGTSIGSIGGERSHTVMQIDHSTVSQCNAEIDEFASMQRKYFQEERLKYECFSLSRDI